MKERPIIFSAPTVNAILAGRKTQTRRIIRHRDAYKTYHEKCTRDEMHDHDNAPVSFAFGEEVQAILWLTRHCRYGAAGDRLWVRETWAPGDEKEPPELVWYRADDTLRNIDGTVMDMFAMKRPEVWKTPLFMPRVLSRLTLEVCSVRVERLNDISSEDALAEGVENDGLDNCSADGKRLCYSHPFVTLWESIHGPGSWDANPWLFVIEFRRLTP